VLVEQGDVDVVFEGEPDRVGGEVDAGGQPDRLDLAG
jgi:hypothetical protein